MNYQNEDPHISRRSVGPQYVREFGAISATGQGEGFQELVTTSGLCRHSKNSSHAAFTAIVKYSKFKKIFNPIISD